MNFMTGSDPLDLDKIRKTLVRLEDTIIFYLIERSQYAHNPNLYIPGGLKDQLLVPEPDFKGSWLDWMLKEIEGVHAKMRRYESPDEHPFTDRSKLPQAILPPLPYPTLLVDPTRINVNSKIIEFYTSDVVPAITKRVTESLQKNQGRPDDDGNYGSAVTRDVEAVQAISRRVHCGMFVSESKFLSAPGDFIPHILDPNPDALLGLITKPAVEAALLKRLESKALWYGKDFESGPPATPNEEGRQTRLEIETVVSLYEKHIIPLTKVVEVEYLLHRLDGLSTEEINELAHR